MPSLNAVDNNTSVLVRGLINTSQIIKIHKSVICLTCEFRFGSYDLYPGQTIDGYIELSAEKPCVIDKVLMEVSGTAECSWKFDKHLVKPLRIYTKGTVFSGEHQFYFSRHTLAGSSNVDISIGPTDANAYPFKTRLPSHLPASWTGKYGSIKYMANVLVKEKNKSTQKFTQEIVVNCRRDLKLEQHLLCEARLDINRNFRYAIVSLGNVYLSIWLPMCGIGVGQGIPVLCTINNDSIVQFGGLIFVLTQLQVYRSMHPTKATITHRKDICRVPRMVDILQGKYEYYCVLETTPDIPPTNQSLKSSCCQVIYEVWVSLQGAIPRYKGYGYPNIDTPGIPIIIGTEPLCVWDNRILTNDIMETIYETRPPIIMEPVPPDDDIEKLLNHVDEELDTKTERNLARQLANEQLFEITEDEENTTKESKIEQEDVSNTEIEI